MAKKRKRKKSIGASLKYEVYGILLITISIIALSGEATVGRSLSKLFGLMLGKFYFVIALVGIYVGLTVMVKRAWPKGWSQRKTGIAIFVLALTLMSSISEIDKRLAILPQSDVSGGYILTTLGGTLREELIDSATSNIRPIQDKPISGGYIGALQYSMYYMLFGYYATKLILIVMFAISLMLMTGKSYVELARIVKRRGERMMKLIATKWKTRSSKPKAPVANGAAGSNAAQSGYEDEAIEDDEIYVPTPRKPRKSLFFAWKEERRDEPQIADDSHDEWTVDDHDDRYESNKPSWQQEQQWEKSGDPLDAVVQAEKESSELDAGMHKTHAVSSVPAEEQASAIEEEPALYAGEVNAEEELHADVGYAVQGDEDDFPDPVIGRPELSEALVGGDGEMDPVEKSPASAVRPAQDKPYLLPPFTLLSKPSGLGKVGETTDMFDSRRKLEATLESFGVRAKVLDVVRGPAVTRYEVQPATGVKVSKIVGLTDDIALALAAKDIRMEAPIPGKSAIGIEVPNSEVSVVTMREVMETAAFQNAPSKLSIAFGRDISGQSIVGNLAKMPHLLVAGATGSGKSVCINGIITSILYKANPDEVKFLMVDPKMVELNVYNGIPHLLAPVVTDPRRASLALKKIVVEMEKRYELFSKSSTRNIEGYNTLMADNPAAVLPYIVVIVDELADLMMVAANDVEDSIARLAQMARAAGIHLIIATQRPSVDVITGVIKANIPSRIAFGVSSQVDSRTILDMAGAEKLLGRGDMLFLPVGMSKPIRVQGAFLSDQEVEALVTYARDQAEAEYKEDLVPEIEETAEEDDEQLDELYDQAVGIVVEAKQASVSLLQRRMRIGYTRAARLIDQMEARSIVGPYEGSKPREVLISPEALSSGKMSS